MPEYVISLLNIQDVDDLMADTAIYAIMLSVQENEIRKVAGRFGFHDVSSISRISAGHINATYRIDTAEGQFILQRINTSVFTEPERMMENISIVTEKIPELRIIKTEDGRLCDREEYGVFRMYNFIPDSVSYEYIDSDQLAERMGKALRNFHTVLSGIDASRPGYLDSGWYGRDAWARGLTSFNDLFVRNEVFRYMFNRYIALSDFISTYKKEKTLKREVSSDLFHVSLGTLFIHDAQCAPMRLSERKLFWKAIIEAEGKIWDSDNTALYREYDFEEARVNDYIARNKTYILSY